MNDRPNDRTMSPRLQRTAKLLGLFMFGAVASVMGVMVVLRIVRGDHLPPLDDVGWSHAREVWDQAGVRDYDIEIVVTGRQAATYAVCVRDGRPLSALRNGAPLKQERTWATWSVEGMFETIARDLETVAKHRTGRADTSTPQLQLRAVFDPALGLPQRYLRTEMVKRGTNPEVSWQVTEFRRE